MLIITIAEYCSVQRQHIYLKVINTNIKFEKKKKCFQTFREGRLILNFDFLF